MSGGPDMDRCPFCAKHGQEDLMAAGGGWHVVCHPCGATGPKAETPEEAVRLWNLRPEVERYAMGLIVEEAAETLKLIGKGLRFGLDAPGPAGSEYGGQSARQLLPIEAGDLAAALRWGELARLYDGDDAATRSQLKLRRLLDPESRDSQGLRLAPDLGWRATIEAADG